MSDQSTENAKKQVKISVNLLKIEEVRTNGKDYLIEHHTPKDTRPIIDIKNIFQEKKCNFIKYKGIFHMF